MLCHTSGDLSHWASWDPALRLYSVNGPAINGETGVVSLADGVDGGRVQRFVSSVKEYLPYSRLVMLSNSLSCNDSYTVRFQPFAINGRTLSNLLGRLWLTAAVVEASTWTRFLACDATDLYLQRNPFLLMPRPGLYYALEV